MNVSRSLRPALLLLALIVSAPVLDAQERRGRGDRGRGDFRRPDPVLEAIDADEDRTLSAEEIDAAGTALVSLDKNGDGNLTKDELAPPDRGGRRRGGPPGFGGGSPLLGALDLDGDGELFEDEVTDAARALRTLDEDGDGVLGEEELRGSSPFGRMRGGSRGRGGFRGFGENEGGGRALEPHEIEFEDGVATIPDRETFRKLSYQGDEVMIDTPLKGIEFVKFTITGADGDDPKMYFINTETHRGHPMFGGAIGIGRGRDHMRGVLCFHPLTGAADGGAGLYTFEFNPGDVFSYDEIRFAYDMLSELAPVVEGRLAFYPLPAMEEIVAEQRDQYEQGGVPLFSPSDAYEDIGFLPLHMAVGYGRLRVMKPGERPSPREVVFCPVLPNEMPRVAGILTGARQTPLSHVNLRAIQDDVPNAYVRGAESLESVRHPALEVARRNRVDRDVARPQLHREALAQVVHAPLARRIGEDAGRDDGRDVNAVHGPHVDDPRRVRRAGSPLQHRRQVPGQEEDRGQIQVDDLAEPLLRKLAVGRAPVRAGVVDEDVQPVLPGGEGLDERRTALLGRDVTRQRHAGAEPAELRRGAVAGFPLARRDVDPRAGLQIPFRDHPADSA